jgi:hypothetical protein
VTSCSILTVIAVVDGWYKVQQGTALQSPIDGFANIERERKSSRILGVDSALPFLKSLDYSS